MGRLAGAGESAVAALELRNLANGFKSQPLECQDLGFGSVIGPEIQEPEHRRRAGAGESAVAALQLRYLANGFKSEALECQDLVLEALIGLEIQEPRHHSCAGERCCLWSGCVPWQTVLKASILDVRTWLRKRLKVLKFKSLDLRSITRMKLVGQEKFVGS